jgi:hypothetical protein
MGAPAANQLDNRAMQWWGNWLANVLIYLLALWHRSGLDQLSLQL